MKRHPGPPTFESRVRGLMLGLALGDAVGSRASDIPTTGTLHAGAATQLAAWTTEGLLRTATRYGGYVIDNPTSVTLYAYQRWAMLRGGRGTQEWFPLYPVDHLPTRGWLIDVGAMAEERGSSPTTFAAVTTGKPRRSRGCQAMLRALPIAAYVGHRTPDVVGVDALSRFARAVAGLTHTHPDALSSTGLAVDLAARMLQRHTSVADAIAAALRGYDERVPEDVLTAAKLGRTEPCVPQLLERLAPDRSGLSAVAGAVYVALSFPELDAVTDAIEFAGWAPDGDSVAACAGAFLGAFHGFEALPAQPVERLELGWVMDRLARDLALQVMQNQAGAGWKGEDPDDPPIDPWWDSKYPGV